MIKMDNIKDHAFCYKIYQPILLFTCGLFRTKQQQKKKEEGCLIIELYYNVDIHTQREAIFRINILWQWERELWKRKKKLDMHKGNFIYLIPYFGSLVPFFFSLLVSISMFKRRLSFFLYLYVYRFFFWQFNWWGDCVMVLCLVRQNVELLSLSPKIYVTL